jgi:hypothetical protein
MNKAEKIAKSIVETLIKGATMHYCTSQSSGECDFTLEYSTGMRVPFEVTSATNEGLKATQEAILTRHGGTSVSRVMCIHDWLVVPLPFANINRIRREVDKFLKAIEVEGRNEFLAWTDVEESQAVEAIFRELKIEIGEVINLTTPGIEIALPMAKGQPDPTIINNIVEAEANKSDNRRKLNAVEGQEKHLFVYLDHATKSIAWAAVRNGELPAAKPTLPPEITHIWMATWTGVAGWHTVYRAQLGSSWTSMGRVNINR